ncbi:unnamed protein product [Soboliphyme baturini]|uniref:Uncharacterized protein n=1 Tax=Soboliphyme baturini TaxID=241478 RepID=A0A183J714_9BILA|nr:unnamed protein product [Soboliphyme baturini]
MGFLRRVATLRLNMVQKSDIRKSFGVQLLVLQIEKPQLPWFGHVQRTPLKTKANNCFLLSRQEEGPGNGQDYPGANM